MADIKTVTLTGGEVQVTIGRRHCHIRNLGNEMIYASLKPSIVPDADGVLGIPAGTKDVLANTDGYVYLKGNGKVQLVGSEFASGILGGLAGGDITAAVAAAVAKIVAGAPADFDTLKEISDWITSHSESAAAMNSDIQSLKTDIADGVPANGGNADTVDNLHASDFVNFKHQITDANFLNDAACLQPYECAVDPSTSEQMGLQQDWHHIKYMPHVIADGFGIQFAYPYSSTKLLFRLAADNSWGIWTGIADNGNADTLDGLHANEIASNPNLLINPDFRINQRGLTIYPSANGSNPCVDGWYYVDNMQVNINDGYITILSAGGEWWSYFSQDVYCIDTQSITATIAYRTTFTGWHLCGAPLPVSETWTQFSVTFKPSLDSNGKMIGYILSKYQHSEPLDAKWIKLELGSIATPFIPPDSTVELLKCGSVEKTPQVLYSNRQWGNISSNPNLLINPDFKINQRGKSEYNTQGYSVDRWFIQKVSNDCQVTVTNDGLSISGTTINLIQPIDLNDYLFLYGKTVTLSADIFNISGNVWIRAVQGPYVISAIYPGLNVRTEAINKHLTFTISDDRSNNILICMICMDFGDYASCTCKGTKLELGSIATPFVPPDPATELLKCRRYYFNSLYRHEFYTAFPIKGTQYATAQCLYKTPMRAIPTTTIESPRTFAPNRVTDIITGNELPQEVIAHNPERSGMYLLYNASGDWGESNNPVLFGVIADAEIY